MEPGLVKSIAPSPGSRPEVRLRHLVSVLCGELKAPPHQTQVALTGPSPMEVQNSANNSEESNLVTVYKRWDDGFLVRTMMKHEAKLVQKWFHDLLPCSHDLEVVLQSGLQGGFIIGEYKGEVVASTVFTKVASDIIYGSYYYVVEKYRNRHFGRRIFEFANSFSGPEYINGSDCVVKILSTNLSLGFSLHFGVSTYIGQVPTTWVLGELQNTIEISSEDFECILGYDNKCFIRPNSEERKLLLWNWIHISGSACFAAVDSGGDLIGYGCRRPLLGGNGHYIGPLYADTYHAAYTIVHRLCCGLENASIQLDICLDHKDAVKLAEDLGMSARSQLSRMYLHGQPGPLSPRIYGLTSTFVCGF